MNKEELLTKINGILCYYTRGVPMAEDDSDKLAEYGMMLNKLDNEEKEIMAKDAMHEVRIQMLEKEVDSLYIEDDIVEMIDERIRTLVDNDKLKLVMR